jgi:hypothetical protein
MGRLTYAFVLKEQRMQFCKEHADYEHTWPSSERGGVGRPWRLKR